MRKRRFAIPSLAIAGLSLPVSSPAPASSGDDFSRQPESPATLYEAFRQDHQYTLAGHRSHSSHRSHGSHRSSSGGGGAYRPSSPPPPPPPPPPRRDLYNSTPPASVLPKESTSPKTLPGNSAKFTEVVMRVQLGLKAYGYYSGAIDGIVGPATRTALMGFQKDFSLPVTGTVTPEVLDALQITIE